MIKIRESLEVLVVIFCGSTTDCQLLVDPFNVIFRGSKTSPSEGPFPCDFFFSCDWAWNLCCPNVPPHYPNVTSQSQLLGVSAFSPNSVY
ncbi:hypothetical protein Peur_050292 [Populus x canadensis]|jgi:hypothetical protein